MKLALSLPWQGCNAIIVEPCYTPQPAFNPLGTNLGNIINTLSQVALYVGGFMMFIWAAWGVFDYIRAEGNKEALAKARKRIQWAIAGFVILILAFFMSDVVQQYLYAQPTKLQVIKDPAKP